MHSFLAVFLCLSIAAVGTNAAWITPIVSVDEDAAELAQLAEQFWTLKPAIFEDQGPLVLCQVIDQHCAPEDRPLAVSLMPSSIVNTYRERRPYTQVLQACFNATALEDAMRSSPVVRRLMARSVTDADKLNIKRYQGVVVRYLKELNGLMEAVNTRCDNAEIHALLCLSSRPLLTSCAQKILQTKYDTVDDGAYHQFVERIKSILTDLNGQLERLYA